MMKIFKGIMIALMILFAFTSCEKFSCNTGHSMSELAGTWTCSHDGYVEALVIEADGSVLSTGFDDEYWENVKGNIAVNKGLITMSFEDDDNYEGHFDFIPGLAFSICTDNGERLIYNYCKEALTDAGMWVRSQTSEVKAETHDQTSLMENAD